MHLHHMKKMGNLGRRIAKTASETAEHFLLFSLAIYPVLCTFLEMAHKQLRPPLWSNGRRSCLQIQRSGFDSRRYQILLKVVGLERGPLSLVSTNEELLGRKSSGSGLEIREYGCRDLSRWPSGTLYPQKLALTSPTSGGRSRTQATELSM
jgi:hypothetical protein